MSLNNGAASIGDTAFSVGSHTITATYSGDTDFDSSSIAFTQTVNKGSTTTVGSIAANTIDFGQAVTFTATVTANAQLRHTYRQRRFLRHDHANRLGQPNLSATGRTHRLPLLCRCPTAAKLSRYPTAATAISRPATRL